MESLPLPLQCTVGIAQIDAEHLRLFQLIAAVRLALDGDGSDARACAQECIEALIDYTRTHFGNEESLMASAGYPALPAHQEMHTALLRKVSDMAMRVELGDGSELIELAAFLNRWLIEHIQIEDRRFGQFSNAPPTTGR